MSSPRADLMRQTEKTAMVNRPVECRAEDQQLFCCQSTYSILTGESEHRNFSFVRDQHMHEKNNSPSPKTNRINPCQPMGKKLREKQKTDSSLLPHFFNETCPPESQWLPLANKRSQIFYRERSPNINLRKQMISTENPRREMPQKIEPGPKKRRQKTQTLSLTRIVTFARPFPLKRHFFSFLN